MKTHILRLDQHDDVISARDKMGWGQAGRILLVWPEHGRVLNRRLDLALLQRRSASLGAQLALVTRDPDVRFFAGQLGIPVFKNLRRAQHAHWRISRRQRLALQRREEYLRGEWGQEEQAGPGTGEIPAKEAPRVTSPATTLRGLRAPQRRLSPVARLASFTLGVLALLSLAAVLAPSAQVALQPKTQVQEITLETRADPKLTGIEITGAVPAHLAAVVVEGRDHLPVSSSVQIPDRPAVGSVRFTNLTDQPVTIPKGSVVLAQDPLPIRFATIQEGTVLSGPGQDLVLPVIALTLGRRGNLPAGAINAIEGSPQGTQVMVTNPEPMTNGKDRANRAPGEDDRRRLYDQLFEALRQSALQELRNGLKPGDLLLASIPTLSRTLEETYDPAENAPADQLDLSLRLEFQTLVVSGSDLRTLANRILDANLPPQFTPIAQTLEIENRIEADSGSQPVLTWSLHARRQLQAQFPENRAVQLSLGISPALAGQRLSASLPLDRQPRISLNPAWWPRMPVLPFRIKVVSSP